MKQKYRNITRELNTLKIYVTVFETVMQKRLLLKLLMYEVNEVTTKNTQIVFFPSTYESTKF